MSEARCRMLVLIHYLSFNIKTKLDAGSRF